MAKIFSIVPLELRPGVTGEEFVKFWREAYGPLGERLGWDWHVLYGDRGANVGHYAVIWVMPSVEARDRITPAEGQLTAEGKRLLEPDFQMLNQKLEALVTGWPYTDYIEVSD